MTGDHVGLLDVVVVRNGGEEGSVCVVNIPLYYPQQHPLSSPINTPPLLLPPINTLLSPRQVWLHPLFTV